MQRWTRRDFVANSVGVRALVEKGRPMIAAVVPTITNVVGGKGVS